MFNESNVVSSIPITTTFCYFLIGLFNIFQKYAPPTTTHQNPSINVILWPLAAKVGVENYLAGVEIWKMGEKSKFVDTILT